MKLITNPIQIDLCFDCNGKFKRKSGQIRQNQQCVVDETILNHIRYKL